MAANDITLIQQVASGAVERTFNPSTSAGYLPRFVATGIGQSIIYDTGTNVGVGTIDPLAKFTVSGASSATTVRAGSAIYDGIGDIRILPQNSQNTAYTLVLTDAGKHILHPTSDTTARTFTIPGNATVPWPVGTAITFVNQASAGTLSLSAIDTMRLSPGGTTGTRTLTANGIATALKIATTEWIISGPGLT